MVTTSQLKQENELFQHTLKISQRSGVQQRLPIDIPKAYKNRLRITAAVEETTMRELVLEALEDLFEKRNRPVK